MLSYADTVRKATELIHAAVRSFIINVGGTLDPDNIEIAIENTGSLPVINPPYHRERQPQLVHDKWLGHRGHRRLPE